MANARKREPDPPAQLRELARTLKGQAMPRAALLRGEERYFVEQGISLLVEQAATEGFELSKHDVADPEFSLPVLLDDLLASPMFSSARCILVRNADATRKGQPSILAKEGSKPSPFTRAVLSFLASERQGSLILTGRSIRADHALAKAIKALGAPLLSCRPLWDSPPSWAPDPSKSELALWVASRARELELPLSPDDCAYIATATGNDLSAIDTQLDKVRREGRGQLHSLVEWTSGGTPWKTADEVLGGDAARGISALESLFRGGFHSGRDGKTEVNPAALGAILLGNMRSKARQGAIAARALRDGCTPQQAAQAAGASAKMARESLLSMLSVRDGGAWETLYREVLELERRSRSGPLVDVNDFVALALRHRVHPKRASRPSRAGSVRR